MVAVTRHRGMRDTLPFGVIINAQYCPHSEAEMTVAGTLSPFDLV